MSLQACRRALNREELRQGGTHAGLLLSRYLRVQRAKAEDEPHIKDRAVRDRADLLHAAIKATQAAKAIYQRAFDRREREFGKVSTLAAGAFKVQGRLIVGLAACRT